MAVLRFGSLFAGIGGFDLGFERAGMRCVWQVEKDFYATKVLERHWPNVRRHGDVRTFPPRERFCQLCCVRYDTRYPDFEQCPKCNRPVEDITGNDWHVDLICGGDPCQSNSAAVGGYISTHANLAGEFLRVVDAIRPRIVVRENPSNVRRAAPSPWWVFRDGLERLGYACLPFRLRACCVGAKHQRERMFVLGTLPDANGYGLEGWESEKAWLSVKPSRPMEGMDWPNIPTARGFSSRAGIPFYVDEMRCIGNAVVPQVAEWIGRRIVTAMGEAT